MLRQVPSWPSRVGWIALAVAAFAGSVVRWQQWWLLIDDAHISFRYMSNELLGHGLVWNPAPFEPVEGYTSFSWVVLLAPVW